MKPIKNHPYLYALFDLLTIPLKRKTAKKQLNETKSILILESHLIGDITLTIRLCRYLKDKYPQKRVVLAARPQARLILNAIGETRVELIEFTAPWTTGHRFANLKNLKQLFKAITTIRKMKINVFIENRGDVRNILFGYFLNTEILISYDFTAGKNLLDFVINDNKKRKHLNYYNFQIAKLFDPMISYEDYINNLTKYQPVGVHNGIIGLHLGASQSIRHLKSKQKMFIIRKIVQDHKANQIILFDDGEWLKDLDLNIIQSGNVHIVKQPFVTFIKSLSKIEVLICLDSGPAHLCSMFGTRTIVLSGPSDIEYTHPLYNTSIISPRKGVCQACTNNHCNNTIEKICYTSTLDRFENFNLLP